MNTKHSCPVGVSWQLWPRPPFSLLKMLVAWHRNAPSPIYPPMTAISIVHTFLKVALTAMLLFSGATMLAAGLGVQPMPKEMRFAFDGLGQDKFAWAAHQVGDAVSADGVVVFCALCKLSAAVGFWIRSLEPLASLCTMILFAVVTACHYAAFGDNIVPPAVLTFASLAKIFALPSTAGGKGKAD